MKSYLIDIIAGARPNFVKIAPIIRALQEHRDAGGCLRYRLVHTGQHYDTSMSGDFFVQLGIPEPNINLGVGSGTQAEQTAMIMVNYEKLLMKEQSQLTLVVGDVTSTMACSITSQKMGIPVAHVEAGIRSNDWLMPEEINRMVTDSITNYFFTTSESANKNLKQLGIEDKDIFFVGNTMVDTLLFNMEKLRAPDLWDKFKLNKDKYFVLTLHRPSNVDKSKLFQKLLTAISVGGRKLPIIFPVHPRTAKILSTLKNIPNNIHFVDPQPYLEFNYLVKNSMAVITDSGGITEECTMMNVPCMTLRDSTERPETVTIGSNELLGTDPDNLQVAFDKLFAGNWKNATIPEKWDGKTGARIVSILKQKFCSAN